VTEFEEELFSVIRTLDGYVSFARESAAITLDKNMIETLHQWIEASIANAEPDEPRPFADLDEEWNPVLRMLSETLAEYED
jgi:hypothetical protein